MITTCEKRNVVFQLAIPAGLTSESQRSTVGEKHDKIRLGC